MARLTFWVASEKRCWKMPPRTTLCFLAVSTASRAFSYLRSSGFSVRGWRPERATQFAANFVVFSLVGPTVEELTFRGLGYSLLERFGRPTAIVVVAIAFGLAHGLVIGFPILAAFGGALAYLRARTGSLFPGILLHASFNLIALLVAVT